MKVVRRGNIKGYLTDAIVGFIDELLPSEDTSKWTDLTEKDVRTSAETWIRQQTEYAIFSHRWLDMGELTFEDICKVSKLSIKGLQKLAKDHTTGRTGQEILNFLVSNYAAKKQGHKSGLLLEMKTFCNGLSLFQRAHCQDLVKLVEFCDKAWQYGCRYVWFDTGCIDKSRSAELEESIRSMFNWYRDAKLCIVHLAQSTELGSFYRDPWFSRGWTLQELLAPKRLLFFGAYWDRITSSTEDNDKVPDDALGIPLWETISRVTGISTDQLLNFDAGIDHARDALTWVSNRQTTRIEDMAYCLIGLLQIPMSIAYGEGAMAFHRLQVEILHRSGNMGLFAWTGQSSPFNSMLAAHAGCFSPLPLEPIVSKPLRDANFTWRQPRSIKQAYMLTNIGLQIPLVVFNASIRSRETHYFKGKTTGMEKYGLELTQLGQVVSVVTEALEGYHHLGIAVLNGLADESQTLAILLGMRAGYCTRIPTEDHIVLSPIPILEKPIVRFIE